MPIIAIETRGPGLYEFTAEARRLVPARADGVLTLFVQHTSCSLLVQENADLDVRADLKEFFRRLAPDADNPAMAYLTHRAEGPDDMPAHIRASLLPVSLSIPVEAGALMLGRWQGIYLFEHRNAPQQRKIAARFS